MKSQWHLRGGRQRLLIPSLLLGAALAACGAPPEHPDEADGIAAVQGELRLGDVGPQVRALHQFLTDAGYFENARLRRDFPGWTPVVKAPPRDSERFDDRTERAVRAYQRLNGLAVSGSVDARTLTAMKGRSCGVPDHDDAADDPRRKWDVESPYIVGSKQTFTYKITAYPSSPSVDSVNWEIGAAFREWERFIPRNFTRIDPSATNPNPTTDISISWGATSNAASLAEAPPGPGPGLIGSRIIFNSAQTWSVGSGNDVATVALHEIGHVLGLKHSSIPGAIMRGVLPPGTVARTLSEDDVVAIASGLSYALWEELRGRGRDIAANGAGNAWVVGTDSSLWSWDESIRDWRKDGSFPRGAKFLSVGMKNKPWVVATDDTIWRLNGSTWVQMPGSAIDVGVSSRLNVSGHEDIYIISKDGCLPQHGCIIKHYNPAIAGSAAWVDVDGRGSRIAVGSKGEPWVVQDSGAIYRMQPSGWELLEGAAWDIGVGAGGTAYVVGRSGCDVGGTCDIYVYNDQRAIAGDTSSPPTADVKRWRQIFVGRGNPAKLFYITVGAGDAPWGANGSRILWRQIRN